RREREDVRQEIADLVGEKHRHVAVFDADVHVKAEDEVRARNVLKILDEPLVAGAVGDLLLLPVAERVGPGGDDPEPVLPGQTAERAAEPADLRAGLADVAADAGPGLDDRLVHLRPDPLAEERVALALLEELADVRVELARLGVDDLELFLDAEGELA